MAHDHPDAPKQFGIRLSDDTMELVSAIQEFRQQTYQPLTLAAIVEDAIGVYYDTLVEKERSMEANDATTTRSTEQPAAEPAT